MCLSLSLALVRTPPSENQRDSKYILAKVTANNADPTEVHRKLVKHMVRKAMKGANEDRILQAMAEGGYSRDELKAKEARKVTIADCVNSGLASIFS